MSNLRDIMNDIYARQGDLTPRLVVNEARDPDHPLHHRFEWDNSKAAERFREVQAGALIRKVTITYAESPDGKDKKVRGWIPVSTIATTDGTESGAGSYRPVQDVLSDPTARQITINAMNREWQTFRRRYENLEEFAALINAEAERNAA